MSASGFLCPACEARLPPGFEPCGWCGARIDWLGTHPEVLASLRAHAERCDWSLLLEVQDRAGVWPASSNASSPLHATMGGLGEVTAVTRGNRLYLDVDGRQVECELPSTITLGGCVLRAALFPSTREGLADRPQSAAPVPVHLADGQPVFVGRRKRSPGHRICELDHPEVSQDHAVIVRPAGDRGCWVVDRGTPTGTWVDRHPVRVGRLAGGDLLQIGPFAWTYNAEDGYLSPVQPVRGGRVRLDRVRIAGRIVPLGVEVPAGELLAIVGPSGAGKSSVVKALAGVAGSRPRSALTVDGVDVDSRPRRWYGGQLGYVAQSSTLHEDLTARQTVESTARLRGIRATSADVERMLREVDLPRSRWNALVTALSGGEKRRLQTAAEFAHAPRVLLLDEPTSGLDRDRTKSLMRTLRGLVHRGATVIVVTHDLETVEFADHVLVLRGGECAFHGTREELRARIPGGSFEDLDFGSLDDVSTPAPTAAAPASPAPQDVRRANATACAQFPVLVRRELQLVANRPIRRLALPALLVPAVFAASIAFAVPATERHLVGFLAVLACTWMGASLALLSIVGEREVFDHEHLLHLDVAPFVAAKTVVLWGLSLLQSWIFWGMLLIATGGRPPLHAYGWCLVVFVLVGWAAVGVGLLLSALVRTSRQSANLLLPLVMMGQILFGVEVAGKGAAPLGQAYGEFSLHGCVQPGCPRRAASWSAGLGWRCRRCPPPIGNGVRDPNHRVATQPDADAYADAELPHVVPTALSYLTISRYGDAALRSFAYRERDLQAWRTPTPGSDHARFDHAGSYWGALLVLIGLAPGLPGCVVLVLALQSSARRAGPAT